MARDGTGRKIAAVLAIAICCGVAVPAAAQGAVRLVVPVGVSAGNCTGTAGNPACDFEYAVETAAGPGDTVSVAPGTHSETTEIVVMDDDLTIAGAGAPQSTLSSTDFNALVITASDVMVRGLRILHTVGTGSGLGLGNGSLIERVVVFSGAGANACRVFDDAGATIRDSVCNATTSGAEAILVSQFSILSTGLDLRNVTAHTTGTGPALSVVANDFSAVVNARNSIFLASGSAPDIETETNPGGVDPLARVDLDFSSYVNVESVFGGSEVTPPGTLSNVAAPPLFVSPNLNFDQQLGSPTVDRGSAAFAGPLDIDGEPRIVNATGACQDRPDIGANEFPTPVPPAASCTATPLPTTTVPPISAPAKTCPKGKKLVRKKGKRKCVRKKRKKK